MTPDSTEQEFRQHIIESIVGTTEEDSVDRAGWGLARGADTAVVAFVSDANTCRRAAVSHAAAAGTDTLAPAPVYLLRIGRDRMIAFNYTPVGEFTLFVILDERGHFLERLVG